MAKRKPPRKRPPAPPARVFQQHLVGYARVSTREQNLEMQVKALKAAGVAEGDMYFDHGKSGAKIDRDGLMSALKACRPAEHGRPASILVVWKLDRVSRSMVDLLMLAEAMRDRGVELRSLTEAFDTSTAMGKFMFGLMGLLAQFERDLMLERTYAGLASAREQGRVGGAPRAHDPETERQIAGDYWARPRNVSHRKWVERVAKKHGVTVQTVFNRRDDFPDLKPPGAPEPETERWRESVRRMKDGKG